MPAARLSPKRLFTVLPILGGSVALIAAQAATSATGYFYWLVAAHKYPVHIIGEAATITSFSMVLTVVSSQAIVASLLVRLPRTSRQRALLRSAVAVSAGVSLLLGLLSVILLPMFIPGVRSLRTPFLAVATVFMCVGQGTGMVADGAALALSKLALLTGRNAAFGFGKLLLAGILMSVVHGSGVRVLVGSWAIVAFASASGSLLILRRATSGSGWQFDGVLGGLGYQMVTAVNGTVPAFLFPTIVTAVAGTVMSGYFSLTWLLGGLCFTAAPAVCQAMLPTHPADLRKSTRQAGLIILAVLTVPMLAIFLAARDILSLFGPGYARYGAGVLVLLAISAIPDGLINIAITRWRIQETLRPAAAVTSIVAVIALALALGPMRASHHSIFLMGFPWMLAQGGGCLFIAARFLIQRRQRKGKPARRADEPLPAPDGAPGQEVGSLFGLLPSKGGGAAGDAATGRLVVAWLGEGRQVRRRHP